MDAAVNAGIYFFFARTAEDCLWGRCNARLVQRFERVFAIGMRAGRESKADIGHMSGDSALIFVLTIVAGIRALLLERRARGLSSDKNIGAPGDSPERPYVTKQVAR